MEAKRVQIPTDPRGIVEWYSCDDQAKDCMLVNCDTCQYMVCLKQTSLLKAIYLLILIVIVIVIVILGVMSPSNSTIGIKVKVVTCLKCKRHLICQMHWIDGKKS